MAQVTITTKTSSDVIRGGALDTWENQRNASSGNTGQSFIHNCDETLNDDFLIMRGFLYFDVSQTNIPAGSRVSAIDFIHPAVGDRTVNNSGQVVITIHTAADPPVNDSYNDITLNNPTEFNTRVNMASLNTGGTTTISLNATAVSDLQSALTSGLWKLCIRGSLDVDNTTPTGLNEYSFTIDNSQIVVTYIPPGGAALFAI